MELNGVKICRNENYEPKIEIQLNRNLLTSYYEVWLPCVRDNERGEFSVVRLADDNYLVLLVLFGNSAWQCTDSLLVACLKLFFFS